jgi:hypothetical protein
MVGDPKEQALTNGMAHGGLLKFRNVDATTRRATDKKRAAGPGSRRPLFFDP